MPHVLKGGTTPDGEPVRPLGRLMAQPTAPVHTGEPPSEARTPDTAHDDRSDAERHRPQVSADSLERVQRLLHEVVTSFARQREELLAQLRPSVIRLVVGMARRIVGRELRTDRDAIKRVIDEALAELGRSGRVVARVAPADAEALRQAASEDLWAPPTMVELDIVGDPGVAPGGCVLESDYGQVDATIATQLDELARTLELEVKPQD